MQQLTWMKYLGFTIYATTKLKKKIFNLWAKFEFFMIKHNESLLKTRVWKRHLHKNVLETRELQNFSNGLCDYDTDLAVKYLFKSFSTQRTTYLIKGTRNNILNNPTFSTH